MRVERVKLYRVGERAKITAGMVAFTCAQVTGEQRVAISLLIRPKSKAPAWLNDRMSDKSPLRLCAYYYYGGKPFCRDGYQIEQLDWELLVSQLPVIRVNLVRLLPTWIDTTSIKKGGTIEYTAGLPAGLKYPVQTEAAG